MIFTEFDIKIFNSLCGLVDEDNDCSNVTIANIADDLGITRQAIYKTYYKNVDEIVRAMHFFIDQDIKESLTYLLNDKEEEPFMDVVFYGLLPKIYEKRKFLKVLYKSNVDPTWEDFLQERYAQVVKLHISNDMVNNIGLSRGIIADLMVKHFILYISMWMKMEPVMSPYEAINLFQKLSNMSLNEVIGD